MNLKKLFVFEIAAVIVVIVLVTVFVGITPYLSSSQNGQIGVYNQREYAQETVTLLSGQRVGSQFNYTVYDPAILVIELKFQDWKRSGNLSLYCNGILIETLNATPSSPYVKLATITFSGFDLVKPPTSKLGISYAFAYGNEISFLSPKENGYEGIFNYKISIRGSR